MASTHVSERIGAKFVFGVLLVAAGLSSLLERLDIINPFDLGRWWPVILIAIGAGKLTHGDRQRQGWFFVGLGTWFLIVTTTSLSFGDTWPALLMFWGIATIWDSVRTKDVATRATAGLAIDEAVPQSGALNENGDSHVG